MNKKPKAFTKELLIEKSFLQSPRNLKKKIKIVVDYLVEKRRKRKIKSINQILAHLQNLDILDTLDGMNRKGLIFKTSILNGNT